MTDNSNVSRNTVHIPILVDPIVHALIEPFRVLPSTAEPHWIVDCTLGGGGHTSALLQALSSTPELQKHRVLAFDQDEGAVERANQFFKPEIEQGKLTIIQSRFGDAASHLENLPVLGLMADLGFSSDQLENSERGLSFLSDGPLDMRLDPSRGRSCRQVLNEVSESELEQWLTEYGEERFAKRIASAIVSRRREGKLPSTTKELSDLVVRAIPSGARHGRIHAATRTFQALRIVVNDELGELDRLLTQVIPCVKKGGRIAILSFHSLEDRLVKRQFKGNENYEPLTKKPIQANDEEIRRNPRARSAKLRIVEKQC